MLIPGNDPIRPALALALGLASLSVEAGVTTAWNTGNVDIQSEQDGSGISVVLDAPVGTPGAQTGGNISFDGSEGFNPGMQVINDALPSKPPGASDVFNCLMAVGPISCNGGRNEGKRFKLNRTGLLPMDLVFDYDETGIYDLPGNDGLYRAFMKYSNQTGGRLAGFTLELSFGLGLDWSLSTPGDGLQFVDFGPTPGPSEISALFPNGLFGPGALPGYFSDTRAGFNLNRVDEDRLVSDGIFGDYAPLFGEWMSIDEVPEGYFYDDDGNPDSDNILLAHFEPISGQWIQNRSLDNSGVVGFIAAGNGGTAYPDLASLEAALVSSSGLTVCPEIPDGQPCLAGTDVIEDLSKFNVTFFIDSNGLEFQSSYTLRVTAEAGQPDLIFGDRFAL